MAAVSMQVAAMHGIVTVTLQHLVLDGLPALVVTVIAVALLVACALRVVTLRRRARAVTLALGTAESELSALFAVMQDVVFVVTRDGRYARVPLTTANEHYRQTPDLVGKHVSEVFPPRAAAKICEISAQVLDTRQSVRDEYSIQFEDQTIWFAATASPFDVDSVLWVARDTTERKVARDALAQSEARYRMLFDRNPCTMWVYDYDTRQIVEVNDSAVAQYGYPREEFQRMTLNDLRTPDEAERLTHILEEMPSDALSVHVVRHRKSDGSIIDVDVRGHPLGVPDRNLRLVVCTDITDRLAAERVVREAEARATATSQMLQALIDAAPQAMVVLDPQWRVTRWNDASEALFGWTASDIIGGDVPFIPDESRAKVEAWRRKLERGAVERPTEAVRLRKDGKRVNVLLAIAPLLGPDAKPTAFIAVYMDLSERKLLEEQLRQSQKLEAIGTLAGGVAHDFNNILTVISSYAAMLLMDDRYPDIRADLQEIGTAARRATGLTRQLLTFSRKAIVQLQPIDINAVVSEMQPMLRRLLMEHIELVIRLADEIGVINADLSQLEQVLMNLTVNAADAMPDGGTLVIETHDVWLDDSYAETHSEVTPGPYVLLAVTDTGTGMDAATLGKIFEPFFTTKDAGRGTGLGLATVYAIVKQLGGHIWVYTEPGHGAAFKIYLPRELSEPQAEPAPLQPGRVTAAGTVLLVEDDVAVRRAARRMLEKAGFTVLEAQDGEHGLSVAAAHSGEIDVVVTDLMMPRMSGGDFALALSATRPRSRVVFTSGYTDDSVLRRRLIDSTHAFVQKPFTADQLVRTINSLLGDPSAAQPNGNT